MIYSRVFTIFMAFTVDLASALSQNGGVSAIEVTTQPTVITSQSCVTGKQVAGICVKRERCDYGTAAIDFTLYRPRGYKLSCPSGEDVCCPQQFLVQHDVRVWVPDNEELDFNDDE